MGAAKKGKGKKKKKKKTTIIKLYNGWGGGIMSRDLRSKMEKAFRFRFRKVSAKGHIRSLAALVRGTRFSWHSFHSSFILIARQHDNFFPF